LWWLLLLWSKKVCVYFFFSFTFGLSSTLSEEYLGYLANGSRHSKAECTNERVEREFTGECRACGQTGHRASACPTAPAKKCRNCDEEGHDAAACENPRKINRDHIETIPAEIAWEELRAAIEDHDFDDVKAAAEKYFKACPDTKYADLEKAFRTQSYGIYLIALEKELAMTYTNSKLLFVFVSFHVTFSFRAVPEHLKILTLSIVDLQGNLDKKYSVSWRWDNKPARPKEKDAWPATPKENIERLADAGEPVDRGIPKCSNCDQLGHIKKNCPEEIMETERAIVKCYNCDEVGHRVRDCEFQKSTPFPYYLVARS